MPASFTALIPAFFAIAILYSIAGLGGGSAYIATMLLMGFSKGIAAPVALGCNIIVSTQGFFQFRNAGHFRWRLFWPFAATSIPLAYVGGSLNLPDKTLSAIFAAALAIAAARLIVWPEGRDARVKKPSIRRINLASIPALLITGAILGLVAGITGIGGGIYLIPVMLLLGIATAKEAAAAAALFIAVNSVAGLSGQLSKNSFDWHIFLPLSAAVFIGGIIGSTIGAKRLKGEALQRIVGIIMLIAVAKLALDIM